MTFNWKNYLKLAKKFAKNDDETSLRCATSRAYYAAFCTCRDYIIQENLCSDKENLEIILGNKGNPHKIVPEIFRTEILLNSDKSEKIAERLDFSRRRRNDADYNSNLTIKKVKQDAEDTINRSEKILNDLPHVKRIFGN